MNLEIPVGKFDYALNRDVWRERLNHRKSLYGKIEEVKTFLLAFLLVDLEIFSV